jgi:hypothetical protein
MTRIACAVAVAIAIAIAPAGARADGTADALNQQGIQAAQSKDWDLARKRFEESYARDPRPLTLFNLAAAQEHTDKLIAARNSYTTFLDKSPPGKNEKFRKLAKAAVANLDAQIPTLHVIVNGLVGGDSVEVDGHAMNATELATPLALDPGDHMLVVLRHDESIVRKSVIMSPGARDEVVLTVPPPHPDPVIVVPPKITVDPNPPITTIPTVRISPQPVAHHTSIFASPWFWGIAAVVVVGAASVGGYFYYHDTPIGDPTHGTLGPGVVGVP